MKDAIKMYHLFFPRKWFIVLVYILYPAVIGLLGMWCFKIGPIVGTVMSLMLSTSFVVCGEYILDVYMLFGVAAKDNRSLEYVKSSAKGVYLLQEALYGDGFRRIVTTVASYGLLYIMMRYTFMKEASFIALANDGEALECPRGIVFVQCALLALLFVEAGLTFTRRTKNVLINLLVLYLMSALACSLAMAAEEYTSTLTVGISGVLLIVIWIVSRKVLIKRVRESFYDEGYKELLQTT